MLRRNQGEPTSTSSGTGDLAHFKLVRKGYDVEQVDAFLLTQATAWSTELAQARQENADLRAQIARRAQDAQAASLSVKDQASAHPAPPIQQTDVEIIARAETTAARIVAEADQQAQTRVRAALRAQEEVLNQRQENLDARFARSRAQYEEILSALHAKVGELQETREALVGGLETIAAGGLAAIEGLSNELPPTDLTSPAELARRAQPELADAIPSPQDNSGLEAALAAEIRAAAEEATVEDEEEGEFDPLTPAPAGIAESTISDTAAAEAQIANAEDQLINAEAHLASLAERLGNAEPLVAKPRDRVSDLGDDGPDPAQQVADPNRRGAVLVPPSILDEPIGQEAGPGEPEVDTEGFQSIDGQGEHSGSPDHEADHEAEPATDPQPEDEDTDSQPASEASDDELTDTAPADSEIDRTDGTSSDDESDSGRASGTSSDDESESDTSLEAGRRHSCRHRLVRKNCEFARRSRRGNSSGFVS